MRRALLALSFTHIFEPPWFEARQVIAGPVAARRFRCSVAKPFGVRWQAIARHRFVEAPDSRRSGKLMTAALHAL